jgi:hypothetical protein
MRSVFQITSVCDVRRFVGAETHRLGSGLGRTLGIVAQDWHGVSVH